MTQNKFEKSSSVTNGPLHGLRVLDLSQMMAGPLCTMLLGDLGADIIKVEPPEGDAIRRTGDTRIGGETEMTLSLNRNKRSIVVDIKTDEGRNIVKQLATLCDIVVENFRPGTTDRLGVGWDVLSALNPRLIYCAMSGFGEDSVNRDRPGLDPIIQAMSGIMQLTGTKESGPLRTGFAVADFVTPVFAVTGILAALHARHASGVGQRVSLSMLDATIFSMLPREGYFFATGKTPARSGNEHYQLVPYNSFDTSDGRQIFVMAHTDKFWNALLKAVNEPTLSQDPRFATNAVRHVHREEVNRRLAAVFSTYSTQDMMERLSEAGALFSLVRTMDEVFDDPEVRRNMVRELDHPAAGRINVLANPVRFSSTPTSIRFPPPLLGEHTTEVLSEFNL
jgi:crotonobetainyl-CoA:carnitine CoA-transferase CaiB-like acyl-CoA transferase